MSNTVMTIGDKSLNHYEIHDIREGLFMILEDYRKSGYTIDELRVVKILSYITDAVSEFNENNQRKNDEKETIT